MSHSHPIGLSDARIALVMCQATLVRPEWRSRWLAAIADQLTGIDTITDDAVAAAITRALASMGAAGAAA
jgi:hypothetical protein